MAEYIVTRKADGAEVYRYQSDLPVEWHGMAFATHDHTPAPVINPDGSIEGAIVGRTLTKLEYLRRFTTEERVAIRAAASVNPVLDDYLKLMELAQEINLDDPDTIAAVQMLEQSGLIAAGRAVDVLA